MMTHGRSAGARRAIRWAASAAGMVVAVGAAAAQLRLKDVPDNHWARAAIETSVRKNLMGAPEGKFEPDRPVTRAELAVVLVRFIDAIEKGGPKPISKSPARHDVSKRQLDALGRLPRSHWATPALTRLVRGGYLAPPDPRRAWLPSKENLDRPATGREVADALASVVLRIEEKKVAVEHPEALKDGDRPETR
jgi:hypothetical protein